MQSKMKVRSKFSGRLMLLGLLAVVCACTALFSTKAFAADDGTFTYEENNNGGITITGLVNKSGLGNLTVPAAIGGKQVTEIGASAFYNCTSLTQIVIPSGVTSIGEHAFWYCGSLTRIELPGSVTSIGDGAFSSCSSLTQIEIPSGVTSIGDSAFEYCSTLTQIELPDSVTSIGRWAFNECYWLTQIEIPSGVTSIGAAAFAYCGSLTQIVIPGGVTSIGAGVFEHCFSLTRVEIPAGVTSIDPTAFKNSSAVKIYTYAGAYAIDFATEKGIPYALVPYVVQFDPNGGTGSMSPEEYTPDRYYTLPGNVFQKTGYTFVAWNTKADGSGTFYTNQKYVNNVTAGGNTVTLYAQWTPSGTFPYVENDNGGITITGSVNNSSCELTIPATIGGKQVTEIGERAFDGSSLTRIELPSGVTSIGDYAFHGCTSLSQIVLPDGVTSIGHDAFASCYSLTQIELPGSVTFLGDYAFESCDSLTQIVIPGGVTSIGDSVFYYCSSLTQIKLPDSVTSIGDYAFSNCSALTRVEIPAGVTSIASSAFAHCSAVTIYTYAGAYALTFAVENAIPYALVPYVVRFDPNGGTGSMSQVEYQPDTYYTLPANTFQRTGYTFAAWNTKADGSGASYADQKYVRNVTAVGNTVTLYAQWMPNDGTFTYVENDNGGITIIGPVNKSGLGNLTVPATIGGKNVTEIGARAFFSAPRLPG